MDSLCLAVSERSGLDHLLPPSGSRRQARLGAARAPGGNGSDGGRDGREAVDHLLGVADPDADFTATDFRRYATRVVESILERGRLPIVAGGSNSFIGALVDGNDGEFRQRYDCCFLCVDVELTELDSFVSRRVDYMVEAGLVEEVRGAFRQDEDYSKGIKCAIGVPEMDRYFRVEATTDKATRAKLLAMALEEIKANTRELARRQREKIRRLQQSGWVLHLLNAMEPFLKRGTEPVEAWEGLVAEPAVGIVRSFLYRSEVDKGNKAELGCRADDECYGGGTVVSSLRSGYELLFLFNLLILIADSSPPAPLNPP
ncbi:hypothetical protein Taro_010927 [Colocasia esculenta]|uniref:Adenylate isopentenyltransferase n=1 Tax=Colocasia esculenta TaxID=4460 RepID=A0A843U4X9_COLES|nr:hypothetical protein [Colocasia esculenta]